MVDYDAVMSGDWTHRVTSFERMSPEEKAELARTHRRRWLHANRERLSPEQLSSMEEQITFLVPELYALRMDPDLRRRSKELEAKLIQLFSRSDVYQLTLHGERVPDVP
jgi:hypothetical protein